MDVISLLSSYIEFNLVIMNLCNINLHKIFMSYCNRNENLQMQQL